MLPVHYSLPSKVFHPLPAHSLSSVARMQVCSTFLHSQINITRKSAHCLLLSTTFNIHLHNNHKQWMHLGSVLSLWPLIQILIGQVRSHLVYLYFLPVDGKVHSDTVGPETLQACCHIVQTWCAFLPYCGKTNLSTQACNSDTFKCRTGNFVVILIEKACMNAYFKIVTYWPCFRNDVFL